MCVVCVCVCACVCERERERERACVHLTIIGVGKKAHPALKKEVKQNYQLFVENYFPLDLKKPDREIDAFPKNRKPQQVAENHRKKF